MNTILVNVVSSRVSFTKSFKDLLKNKEGKCGRASAVVTYITNEAVIRVSNRLRSFCQKEAYAIPKTGGWLLTEKKFKELWVLYEIGKEEIQKHNEGLVNDYDKNRADFKATQGEYLDGRFTKAKARKLLDSMLRDYPSKLALATSCVEILCDFGENTERLSVETKSIVSNSKEKQTVHAFYSGIARDLARPYEIAAKLAEQYKAGSIAARTIGTLKISANGFITKKEAMKAESTVAFEKIFYEDGSEDDFKDWYQCDNMTAFIADCKKIAAVYEQEDWGIQFVDLIRKYHFSETTTSESLSEERVLNMKAAATTMRGTQGIPEYTVAAELSRYVADNAEVAEMYVDAIYAWCYKHGVETSLPKIKFKDEGDLLAASAAGAYDIHELHSNLFVSQVA